MNNGASATSSENKQTINGSWRLDRQRSRVEFRTPGLWGLVPVKGRFEVYDGWLDLAADPAIELAIDAASLTTGNRKRDKHLRSADFFDSDQHPQVRFVSEFVTPEGQDRLRVRGRLSARGSSIPLELGAQVRQADGSLEIESTVSVRHRKLGMTWNWLGAIRPESRLHVAARLMPDS